jgi:hypothetical protein
MVYFIGGIDTPVKIGYSEKSPLGRMKSLQTGCWNELQVFGLMEHWGRKEESECHSILKSFRMKGEWFEKYSTLHFMYKHTVNIYFSKKVDYNPYQRYCHIRNNFDFNKEDLKRMV